MHTHRPTIVTFGISLHEVWDKLERGRYLQAWLNTSLGTTSINRALWVGYDRRQIQRLHFHFVMLTFEYREFQVLDAESTRILLSAKIKLTLCNNPVKHANMQNIELLTIYQSRFSNIKKYQTSKINYQKFIQNNKLSFTF